jgi:acyl-CoA thioester hydrolase
VSERPIRPSRADFRAFRPIQTRWMDNDAYGHVNNVVYYSWFDTLVNAHLVEAGLLDPATSPVVGLVAETGCTYHESVSFPEALDGALAVERLGRSSVRYRLGIFRAGADLAAAVGRFTHVYVDRATNRPVEIPGAFRRVLEAVGT